MSQNLIINIHGKNEFPEMKMILTNKFLDRSREEQKKAGKRNVILKKKATNLMGSNKIKFFFLPCAFPILYVDPV